MLQIIGYYGFTDATAILAVNYFDRFVFGFYFQKDKPSMSQLAAVACLSIAAKIEETQVPILLDLQRFGFMNKLYLDFLKKCERLILDIALVRNLPDSRILYYTPSVITTIAISFVVNEIESYNATEYQNQLMSVLKVGKDNLDECHDLILELIGTYATSSAKASSANINRYLEIQVVSLIHILGARARMIHGSWNSIISLYEDRILDVEIVGGVSGSITVTIEEDLQRWHLLFLAFGIMLLVMAPIVSSWVLFYYNSLMAIRVCFVIIVLLFQLNNLVYLNLSINGFTKKIPKGFELMANLEVLDLHGNMLDGTLDPEFLLLTTATYVDSSGNLLVISTYQHQKILSGVQNEEGDEEIDLT
ncbi:hypothetical protein T459_28212 [Capsicum annuum]|uniref:Cyclin-like domain-containing protein n=1 Tax=Capsicum annuum TaxID=4072 RepID=A0A2G2YG77_CAPAN|nr:hypothetical protein T459_28212 [Capsicum annuum]